MPRVTSSTSRASSSIAHDIGVPLVIDNTLASPYLAQPLSRAPTSSPTRPRSSSAGTARRSAGSIVDAAARLRHKRSGPRDPPSRTRLHGLIFSQLPEGLRPAQYILKCRSQIPAATSVPRSPPSTRSLPPGPRDAQPAASSGQLAERARGRAVARGPRRGRVGEVPRPRVEPVAHAVRSGTSARAGRDRGVGIKGSLEAGRGSSTRSSCTPPRRRRQHADLAVHPATTTHSRLDPDGGPPRRHTSISCGCRSASRASPTSSRSRNRLPRDEGRLTRVGMRPGRGDSSIVTFPRTVRGVTAIRRVVGGSSRSISGSRCDGRAPRAR